MIFTGPCAYILAQSLARPLPPPPEPIRSFLHGPPPIPVPGPYAVGIEIGDWPPSCYITGPGIPMGVWPCDRAWEGSDLANAVWAASEQMRLDFNGSGRVDSQDFFDFLTAFNAHAGATP